MIIDNIDGEKLVYILQNSSYLFVYTSTLSSLPEMYWHYKHLFISPSGRWLWIEHLEKKLYKWNFIVGIVQAQSSTSSGNNSGETFLDHCKTHFCFGNSTSVSIIINNVYNAASDACLLILQPLGNTYTL